MRHFRTVLLVGVMVFPISMLAGCGDSASKRSGIDRTLKNAKIICGDLKETFQGGETIKDFSGGTGQGRPDGRMGILVLQIQDKIRATIQRRENDTAKREKALAKLKESDTLLIGQIIPKYEAAVKSKKSEDAKSLVPLMEQLDKQLDELNDILNS